MASLGGQFHITSCPWLAWTALAAYTLRRLLELMCLCMLMCLYILEPLRILHTVSLCASDADSAGSPRRRRQRKMARMTAALPVVVRRKPKMRPKTPRPTKAPERPLLHALCLTRSVSHALACALSYVLSHTLCLTCSSPDAIAHSACNLCVSVQYSSVA